jgi:hypothetical protein
VAHWGGTSPPTLVLYPGTENFHAQIIAAFTVQELEIRASEKAEAALAGVRGLALKATMPLVMFDRGK